MALGDFRGFFGAAGEIAKLAGFARAGATIAGRDQADGRGHLGDSSGLKSVDAPAIGSK
jgi:hypothetical protein